VAPVRATINDWRFCGARPTQDVGGFGKKGLFLLIF
jgi:hypothetical protein